MSRERSIAGCCDFALSQILRYNSPVFRANDSGGRMTTLPHMTDAWTSRSIKDIRTAFVLTLVCILDVRKDYNWIMMCFYPDMVGRGDYGVVDEESVT
eukprot:scaffold4860_cov171-Amphora_coffeaeformis.AAC.15